MAFNLKPSSFKTIAEAVNAGEVDAPDFYANKYAYCRARFIFGGKGNAVAGCLGFICGKSRDRRRGEQ